MERETLLVGPTPHGQQRDFFVELDQDLQQDPVALGATLAHEVGHLLLHRAGVRFEEPHENEILTDRATALWGFGVWQLKSFVHSERSTGERSYQRQERLMGYLTPEELAYLVARSGQPEAEVRQRMEHQEARQAVTRGYDLVARERSTPPLARASHLRRAVYRLRRRLARGEPRRPGDLYWFEADGRVVFRCPHCCQPMRLPPHKTLRATCPGCGAKMDCCT